MLVLNRDILHLLLTKYCEGISAIHLLQTCRRIHQIARHDYNFLKEKALLEIAHKIQAKSLKIKVRDGYLQCTRCYTAVIKKSNCAKKSNMTEHLKRCKRSRAICNRCGVKTANKGYHAHKGCPLDLIDHSYSYQVPWFFELICEKRYRFQENTNECHTNKCLFKCLICSRTMETYLLEKHLSFHESKSTS